MESMISRNATVHFAHFTGEIDISRRKELAGALLAAESSDVAILDFRGVTYMDSTVLNGLVTLKRRMLERGKLGIVRVVLVHSLMRRLFKTCQLDWIFELYPSVEDAWGLPAS